MNPQALDGVRVIDISSFYAAPFAATLLADFGAEVIKVEPPEGDGMRGTGMWTVVGRNKKSITLDLRQPEGCEILKSLVAKSDVVFENFLPGVLAKRGIGWEQLSALQPKLIMATVTCYGTTGPYAPRAGNGTTGEGFGGLVHLTGPEGGMPVMPSLPLGDGINAMNIALGVMMALYWRDVRGGAGQHIDATLYEPILHATSHAVSRWQPGKPPGRHASRVPGLPIRNVYAGSDDRYLVMSTTTPRHTADVIRLAGGAPEERDPDPIVARWIRSRPMQAALDELTAMRIPVAPVNDLEAILADPHVRARESLVHHRDPELGDVAVATPSPRLSKTPGAHRDINPKLGGYNEEILGDLLGLDAAKRRSLAERKVI